MQEYFRSINVDPSEAKGLFQLLDSDDSGILSMDELVEGLLRLRGGATALELSLHMYETARMNQLALANQAKIESALSVLLGSVSSLGSSRLDVPSHAASAFSSAADSRASVRFKSG